MFFQNIGICQAGYTAIQLKNYTLNPEDGDIMFLSNITIHLQEHMDCNLGTTHFNHENGSSIFL
jgi:hypothetical protein